MNRPLSLGAEEFLSWLSVERGRSRNTIAAYRRDLSTWERWASDTGVDPMIASVEEVERHLSALREGGRNPASVARAVSTLRGLYRFLVDEGIVRADPTTDLASPKPPRRLPKALDEDQTMRLIDSVRGIEPLDYRDRALLELLYGTGARISEVVGLSIADVQSDDGLLRVFGKGAKERLVPLGTAARHALTDWLSPVGRPLVVPEKWSSRHDAEAVFLNTRGSRLSRQGAWLVLKRHASRVGLSAQVSPHVLRHSCASHMLAHGADIRVVQELLGHASVTTTQLYTKLSPEHLRASYESAHPRAGTRSAK